MTPDIVRKLAVDALNVWRDYILVLADACEEAGLHEDAKYLRMDVAAPSVVLPVDHHATKPKTIRLESLALKLLRLAKPRFYLSKSSSNKKLIMKIWTRERRRCVYTFTPRLDLNQCWEPHTAKFTLEGDGESKSITLELCSDIIRGCFCGKQRVQDDDVELKVAEPVEEQHRGLIGFECEDRVRLTRPDHIAEDRIGTIDSISLPSRRRYIADIWWDAKPGHETMPGRFLNSYPLTRLTRVDLGEQEAPIGTAMEDTCRHGLRRGGFCLDCNDSNAGQDFW